MTQDKAEMPAQYQSLCSECQTGVMRLKYITYFTWLNEELITVPNFPAWVCDVCGKREYDNHAVVRLNTMLSQGAGRKPAHRRGRRRPGAARPGMPRT